ncbi:MAG: 3,4-dihydroxy-2-butanone-4-phosphate synthase [Candidatus Hadarchaeales archaeon]
MNVRKGASDLAAGKFVLLHDSDGRENEVDMIIGAEFVKPEHVTAMRTDAGGLICVAVHPLIARNIGLPYLSDVYASCSDRYEVFGAITPNDIPYDERSAFSITVNHRKTFTGVTDVDRAMTISELGRLGARAMREKCLNEFGRKFRSPGHVTLLRAAEGLLDSRRGHTELAVVLAGIAGITPAVVLCEMLDSSTGKALSTENAAVYARRNGLTLLDGAEVFEEFRRMSSE